MGKSRKHPARYHKGMNRIFLQQAAQRKQERENKAAEIMAQLITWLAIVALNDVEQIGARRVTIFAAEFEALCDLHRRCKQQSGEQHAEKRLQEETASFYKTVFVPDRGTRIAGMIKAVMEAENKAALTTMRIIALTLHNAYGFGATRIARVEAETAANYKQFCEMYADDAYYAYEVLRRRVQQILQCGVQIIEEETS